MYFTYSPMMVYTATLIPVTHERTKYSIDKLYYGRVPSAEAIVGELILIFDIKLYITSLCLVFM